MNLYTELSECQEWIEQTNESESRKERVAFRLEDAFRRVQSNVTRSRSNNNNNSSEKWGENRFCLPLQYTTFDFYVIYRLMRRRLAHLPQSENATSIVYGHKHAHTYTFKWSIHAQPTPNTEPLHVSSNCPCDTILSSHNNKWDLDSICMFYEWYIFHSFDGFVATFAVAIVVVVIQFKIIKLFFLSLFFCIWLSFHGRIFVNCSLCNTFELRWKMFYL